jgi:putative hydrolase of the HAD superfamily
MTPAAPPSPLGCRLRDWDLRTKEAVASACSAPRRGIVLDLDDTLYPREEFVQSGLMAVARWVEEQHGVTALDAYATMAGARREAGGAELQALCAKYGLATALVPVLLTVFRTHQPVLRLPRVTGEVLGRLRTDAWRLAIVTNGLPAVQRSKVAALGLAPLVHHVIYADEHRPGGKPAPAVFRTVLQRLGLPAARCICVGDDPECDIAGARRAGMKTIRLLTPHRSVAPGSDADATIVSLEALPEVASGLLDQVRRDAA